MRVTQITKCKTTRNQHTHTLLHIAQVAAKTQHKCAWILDEAPCKKLMEFVCVCLVIKPQRSNIYQHGTDRQDPQKYCGYHETIKKSNEPGNPMLETRDSSCDIPMAMLSL